MRIAIFTDLYAPWAVGGIISSIQAQKAELERLGHEIVVFCPGFAGESDEKNVVCVPSHRFVKVNGAVISKRPTVVERFVMTNYPDFEKFDTVHVHYEASCSIAGVNLAKKFKIPLVQTMHGREDVAVDTNIPRGLRSLVAGILNFMHRHYLMAKNQKVPRDNFQAPTWARAKMWELMVRQAEQADVVITPSEHFAKKLQHYGVTRTVMPVSNGVPDELTKKDFAVRSLAEDEELKMIWNSRVSKEKRILPFLQALAKVQRPYKLYVYGDGNALRAAKKYAKRQNLKVKFLSLQSREKIMEQMRTAHLGVVASYNFDTQGMVLLEAEATGLPVFLCDLELTEPLPEGGYMLSEPDVGAMAQAINDLSSEKIAEMSKIMIESRGEIAESVVIRKMLEAYKAAREKNAG